MVGSIFRDALQQVVLLLTQPAAIPFVLAFVGGFFVYHLQQRRQMLAAKAVVDALYGMHYYMMHAYAGAYGIAIAVLGGLVQIVTPDHLMRRTMLIRNIVAALLALLGCFVAAQQATDFLPLIAASSARFVETQAQPQRIRLGMSIILILWLLYALENHLVLIFIAQGTLLVSLLIALYRHHMAEKR